MDRVSCADMRENNHGGNCTKSEELQRRSRIPTTWLRAAAQAYARLSFNYNVASRRSLCWPMARGQAPMTGPVVRPWVEKTGETRRIG